MRCVQTYLTTAVEKLTWPSGEHLETTRSVLDATAEAVGAGEVENGRGSAGSLNLYSSVFTEEKRMLRALLTNLVAIWRKPSVQLLKDSE